MLEKRYFFNRCIILFFVLFYLVSCATSSKQVSSPRGPLILPTSKRMSNEVSPLNKIKPLFKKVSPLDTKIVTLSVKNENFRNILQMIAKEAGLNLVISKDVNKLISDKNALITAEFHQFSLRDLLNAITESLGLHYEIKYGVLYIEAYEERIFDLGFLTSLRGTKFDLGGDVLGGNMSSGMGSSSSNYNSGYISGEIVNPLKGNFQISGQMKTEVNDIYRSLEQNVKTLLSKDGIYTINRFTGTLFVIDYAQNVKRIAKFIEDLRDRYQKQVLIEAKIVEIELSKQYELGVNWQAILNNNLKDNLYLESQSSFFWGDSQTFLFQVTGSPYFDIILQALETYGHVKIVSNPRLRVMHGQPAMISVGRSISYVKEIERQITSSENISTIETNVQTSAIFDGLLFGVTPYIEKNGDIILHIIPIKSDIIDLEQVKFGDNYTVTLPQVNLRETTTVIKVHPNDLVIIGGLILDSNTLHEHYVSGLAHLPGIGKLFRHKNQNSNKVELVILLKVTLVG